MKGVVRLAAALAAACALQGCSGIGGGESFTDAECTRFTQRFMAVTEVETNGIFKPEEVAEMRTGLVQECMAGKMGITREQLECGNKSNTTDEFAACKVVIRG